MSRITTIITKTSETRNNNILFYIATDNYPEFSKLINEANVNTNIDQKNGYNALHHAVKANNDKMIEYLLSMGANPYLKTTDGQDAFDLSLRYQTKCVIRYELNDKCETSKELQKTISTLEKKIISLNENNKYLMRTVDEAVRKNDILRVQLIEKQNENLRFKTTNSVLSQDNVVLCQNNSSLHKENHFLGEQVSTLKKSNEGLSEDVSKLKRKYDSLDASYTGLVNKMRK